MLTTGKQMERYLDKKNNSFQTVVTFQPWLVYKVLSWKPVQYLQSHTCWINQAKYTHVQSQKLHK